MGKRSRNRGSAKQRNHRETERRASAAHDDIGASMDAVRRALVMAARVTADGNGTLARDCAARLIGPASSLSTGLVQKAAAEAICTALQMMWQQGWLPGDVRQIVLRRLTAEHARLAVDLIAEEVATHKTAALDPAWRDQLGAIEAVIWWRPDVTVLGAWSARSGINSVDGLVLAIELLGLLLTLPALPRVLPPPGGAPAGAPHSRTRPEDERMLERVRSLLAKAESTEFPDEAEALSAKAQQLMARHSLSRLMVESRSDERQQAAARRLWIDAPYAEAKALLAHTVADANRCQAVWSGDLGFVTLIGEERDLDATELLTTSLLVQATRAMVDYGRRAKHGHTRSRSFRQSFLVSYARRIGERLSGVSAAAAATYGDDLLPVLAGVADRVRSMRETLFPATTARNVTATNSFGWASGRAAADLATIDSGVPIADESRAS